MDKAEKKRLINEYKQSFRHPGVLIIKNKMCNKVFVNTSMDIEKLVNRQLCELKAGRHMNKALQKDWQKYGEENFSIEIVERIEEQKELNFDYAYALKKAKERWLEKLNPYGEMGYH